MKKMLLELQDMGVKSLMVEGGASVISSFINSGVVDRLVVTGLSDSSRRRRRSLQCRKGRQICFIMYARPSPPAKVPSLEYIRSQAVGRDTVMAWRGWRLGFR